MTAATYVPPSHDLFYGDTGSAVRSVQNRLSQLHYYPGPIDGVYGPDMEQAVWAFKEVQGLPMNAYSNSVVTWAFRKALVHPRLPKVLVKNGGAERIEINQSIEVLVLYKSDKVHLILHVSTGGNCLVDQGCGWITPDGDYTALSFLPGWVQVPLGEMYNPVFFIGTAYAIHGDIPVPWFPDSHGCVRIWMDAATWFHTELTVGGSHATPVYIRGTAPYSSLANLGAVFTGA
ncbi:MAG TPA: L,D-transpeptidase family protein [Streptosporangiaceae bacterium]|nr:L,D-transpeptidase family protein [Streptosporangiaceae bacterium]